MNLQTATPSPQRSIEYARSLRQNSIALAVCILAALSTAAAKTTMPFIFVRNMVLQAGVPMPVWGKASPGETVTVEFAGQSKSAVADPDGGWRVDLDPLQPSSEPRDLCISGAPTITGVLVGDVWVAIGDANMNLPAREPQPENSGENPLIRQYCGRGGSSPVPQNQFPNASFWATASGEEISKINPVVFGFAKAVQEKSGIPIGIINQSNHRGGSLLNYIPVPAHSHLPKEGPAADLQRELESIDPASEAGNKTHRDFREEVAAWRRDAGTRIGNNEFPLPLPKAPGEDTSVARSYNALVHPLVQFPVKGFIFFHHDRTNTPLEATEAQLKAMILGMRDAFKNPTMPFYIAGFHNVGPASNDPNRGALRWSEATRRATSSVPMSGVAVASDLGAPGSYASLQPQELGRRLGLLANRQVHGDTTTVASGPTLASHAAKDAKVVLTFDSVGSGLASDGPLGGFAIADTDGKFHWATATIVGNTVELAAAEVASPTAVHYDGPHFTNGSRLRNKEGLPAVPFAIEINQ